MTAAFGSIFAVVAAIGRQVAFLPAAVSSPDMTRSITDRRISWPTWEQWQRVLLAEDYNTRLVVFGTAVLGCAAGVVGCFTLLRKRALMGDALSHATLPGIVLAFMIAVALGGDPKSLPVLLAGATVSGLIGVAAILVIRSQTRLKEDTALGIVLSVFFGAGIALLGVSQQMPGGHAAGLESFIFGKTASMNAVDAQLITGAALACIIICLLTYKELKLLCFDEEFAGSQGYNLLALDLALMSTVVMVSIVGLQAVGLILMIAMLIVPAAAARFWTNQMSHMLWISALIGAIGGMAGSATSALFPRLPSGAMIVLACAGLFLLSMIFGTTRGILIRNLRRSRLNRSVTRRHLLRAIYERLERMPNKGKGEAVPLKSVLPMRSWNAKHLRRAVRRAERKELLTFRNDEIRLTKAGRAEAARLTREHRLWELYLITHAEVATGRVDREAERIEHVLEPAVVAELEEMLSGARTTIPQSPHDIDDQDTRLEAERGVR